MGGTAWHGAGDESAFGELVQRYRSELLVHCYRMLGWLPVRWPPVREPKLTGRVAYSQDLLAELGIAVP
ncbi:hypothetical protein GCM10009609_29270 [Pseudonocardia aurantiaca]|uniref:Uncharacterized protein n=1 Tax=Pseudonocardia aurantiaca TaxID=75290 RepID=A0ABW4FJ06_9PSEU